MSRDNHTSDTDHIILKIEPTGSSILTYTLGIVFGILFIIVTVSFDIKFNSLFYYLILMGVLFYLIIDHGYRNRNNIRLIELDKKTLNIYKGKKMQKHSIQLSKLVDARCKKRLLSVVITLRIDTAGHKKALSYHISSEHIHNSDLLNLFQEIKRLSGVK